MSGSIKLTIDGHGLSEGDRVLIKMDKPVPPPMWAFWRYPAYWRALRRFKRISGVYVVTGQVRSQ
jgi:hypothetical protein